MARTFNGLAANRISVGDPAALDIATTLTAHAWFRLAAHKGASQTHTLVSKFNAVATPGWALDIERNAGNTAAFARMWVCASSALDVAIGTTAINLSTWYAVTGVKNGTGAGSQLIYLNGVQDGTLASTRALAVNNVAFGLGVRSDIPDTTASNGDLAEVAVWDVALTAAEVGALAKGVCPLQIRRGNLKGYWPLYGVAFPEPDLSGNINNGTLAGSLPAANHAPVQAMRPTTP